MAADNNFINDLIVNDMYTVYV